jgi:membrane-associated phospholipid phosphatase
MCSSPSSTGSGPTAAASPSRAAFLQRRYGWSYGVPAYAVATFVAYSRVESKRHWTSDVIAGGAIGIATNLVFTHKWSRVVVQPSVVPRGAELTFEIRW